MKRLLQNLLKVAAYAAAAIVILLAIAVGLFRLLLPRLPEYQEDIKAWASSAIGMQVEFTGMDARWGLRGPELKFYQAELIRTDNQTRVVAADEVGIGVSLARLLIDRTLVVDTVAVSDTSIEIRQLVDGSWQVQGTPIGELAAAGAAGGAITVIGDSIDVQLIQPGDERPTFFDVSRLIVQRDAVRIAIDASVRLPDELGRQMNLSVTHISPEVSPDDPWHVTIEADDFNLAGVSALYPNDDGPFDSGFGDLNLSLEVMDGRVLSASADVAFTNVALAGSSAFDVEGHVAWDDAPAGWLVAAHDFSMVTSNGEWPSADLRIKATTDEQGRTNDVEAAISYLNVGDVALFAPVFTAAQRELLDRWQPTGVITNLWAEAYGLTGDEPSYEIRAAFDGVGVAAGGRVPGVRGLSGDFNATQEGGNAQIYARGLTIAWPSFFNEALEVDNVDGALIWRRSGELTRILSDNIAMKNAFFESRSNIEIELGASATPMVDLSSTWSIEDIGAAKRFIPEPVMHPKLYLWFQDALVSGRMPNGRTRLTGPLDRFPFDGGEGRLLVEATIEDLLFRYARQFPASEVSEMQIVLDNTRLYTDSNRSVSLGNETVDARVEIADLREPVLTIDALSTGTLATIREFAANSPIARVFGGQLDRISVDGDATLKFDMTMPLRDRRSYEFRARVDSSDGRFAIAGLKPEFTELSGAVIIEREFITSEALRGRFLSEPVAIELRNATPDMPSFRVVASATGAATGGALADAFQLPLAQHFEGRTEFRSEVLFPRAGIESPAPLTIIVESTLEGLGVDLPPPLTKPAETLQPVSGTLRFIPGGTRVETEGRVEGLLGWSADIVREDDGWDFDRGVLMFGDGELPVPDVRGLHVRGDIPRFRLDDWLALSRGETAEINAAERIRSVDVRAGELRLLGQRLLDHRVRIDRSARDWLVQFEGEQVSGSIFVPYDFESERALVLDMERLILPGDDEEPDGSMKPSPDPRRLPPISFKAKEFALGNRYFGEVVTELAKTEDGLVADSIVATDATFDMVGNGRWVNDAADLLGSRSYLTVTLTSRDVEETMRRLDYEPGIVSDDMGLLMDLSWSGGPRGDFLNTLDGEVQVRFGTGQLDEVDPGAGRMFGLMSIVALPRRLSLDFRDVFQKGFGFDKIEGTFEIEDGVAYTCNLSLEGPAADIGIIGRADLVDRSYEQTAVVSANFGSTLPVVGALAAGPQAAAAMFLFSQIFKEPLADIGQVYYHVSGSWDDPAVESADAKAFADSGQLAGCLEETE